MHNVEQLENILHDEWKMLPLELAEKLVASMTSRCQAVIDVKERHISY